ncbi:hypothetical protein BDW22DRAFT_1335076 [Trametopsis cervina]|nr:hypothetical protein BDW22DRAFT_1335076 [Trametopsis cervina]
MPVTLSPIARFFSHLHPPSKASLNILPNDILVDVVFTYLSVRDILRMRRVSKLYYQLTHHPVIWKRLLRTSHLPIPPLPPTSRHSLENLTGLEAERLLTRAHSLDKIWRWSPPESGEGDLYERWEFDAQRHVAHMVLLPGSQYLVASVSDATRQDWALIIYVLDSRYNVIPIAKTDTRTKAYNLQAKYLTVNGVHGITISYVRRDWRRRAHGKRGINVSEYSADHEIDAPYPLKYECITFHVPLRTLEGLCDTRFVPGSRAFLEHAKAQIPPFQQICLIRSSRKLGTLSLDDFAGKPYLTLMRFPNDIMFKPLNGGPLSVLTVRPIPQFAANVRIASPRPIPHIHSADHHAVPLHQSDPPAPATAADPHRARGQRDVRTERVPDHRARDAEHPRQPDRRVLARRRQSGRLGVHVRRPVHGRVHQRARLASLDRRLRPGHAPPLLGGGAGNGAQAASHQCLLQDRPPVHRAPAHLVLPTEDRKRHARVP